MSNGIKTYKIMHVIGNETINDYKIFVQKETDSGTDDNTIYKNKKKIKIKNKNKNLLEVTTFEHLSQETKRYETKNINK